MVELKKASVLDYIRFVLSTVLLLFCTVVTFYAIIERKTHFWDIVPGWAALLIFIVCLAILGIVEGLQIALVELKRQHPDSYKNSHPLAYRLGQVAAKGDNVERFLMGRQVFVVLLVFFAAKLTTITLAEGDTFLFPVPKWVEKAFLETGILSCVLVVSIAQLMPQIVAAKYPVHFLQFCIMRPAYYACIGLEMTGITHATWLLSALMSSIFRMKNDEFDLELSNSKYDNKDLDEIEKQIDEEVQQQLTENGQSVEKSSQKIIPYKRFSQFSHIVHTICGNIDSNALFILKHYLDSHPEKFYKFPSVVGNKVFPAPNDIAQQFKDEGNKVPRFLTDISDPEHIPPHIVAVELLAQNKALTEEIQLLKSKLDCCI